MPSKTLLLTFSLFTLSGCASLFQDGPANGEQASDEPAQTVTPVAIEKEPPAEGSFRPEELFLLLTGEIAAHRGQYDVTMGNYVEAALQSRDPGVIRRAVLIADSLQSQSAMRALTNVWVDVSPASQDARRAAAIQALRDGNLEAALTHLEAILDLGGDADFDSFAAMGARLEPAQQLELLNLFRELQQRHPENPEIQYSLALLQNFSGAHQEALATVTPLVEQDPQFQPALVLYGELLYETDQTDKALRHLQANTRRYPDNRQLGTLYARLLLNENEFRGAQDEFARMVKRFPDEHGLRLSWALVAIENEEFGLARRQLEHLEDQGQHTDQVSYYLGQLAEKEGNTDRAITRYEQVTAGSHYFPALSRAAELRAEAGDPLSAIEQLRAMRATNPEASANLWLIEIDLLQKESLDDLALESADKALAEHPENQSLLYTRSMLHEQLGNIDQTESDLRTMIALERDNPTALNALGYILTVHTERYAEARQYIEDALVLEPENPAILDSMGWVLFQQGDSEGALDYLRQAYDIYPDPEIAAHYGEVLHSIGEESQARVVWKRALDDDPDHELLLETLERLEVTDL